MADTQKIKYSGGDVIPAGSVLLKPRTDKHRDDTGDDIYWITPRDKSLIRDLRYVMRENQTDFWSRFGVTQSRGSRFEHGTAIPLPVLLLMRLYLRRIIDDDDLNEVRSSD